MNLRTYQQEAVAFLTSRRRGFLVAPAGSGKCLGKDTLVLLANGDTRVVQDVVSGDLLMGPDGEPRRVLSVCRGREELFRVVPIKGDAYTVNRSHVLSLVKSSADTRGCPQGSIVNVSVNEWLKFGPGKRKDLKGWRAPAIPFFVRESTTYPMPPYILGLWLGDGTAHRFVFGISKPDVEIETVVRDWATELGARFRRSAHGKKCPGLFITTPHNTPNPALLARRAVGLGEADCKTRGIPEKYKCGPLDVRLQVLAGLLDSDGHLSSAGYDFISKERRLSEDVTFIARSLGLAAYMKPCRKGCQTGAVGDYFRVSISGDTHVIPCRIPRKKAPSRGQIKDVRRTGIRLEPLGVGDYYGFEIEGPDRLFLLGDFTVTHNTVCGSAALLAKQPASFAWVANTKEQVQQAEVALTAVGLEGLVCCMMARPDLSSYDVVVIDEAAHAPAKCWDATISTVRPDATLWGLSATPWSEDETRNDSLKATFVDFAFIDREEVMAGGHLVPGVVRPVDLDTPMQFEQGLKPLIDAEVKLRCARFRFVPEHEHRRRATWQLTLEHLQNNVARNAAIINIAKAEMEAGETVIVLVSSIAHGEALAASIPGAEVLHSKLPAKLRRHRVEALREGTLKCAVATSLMDEGADFPIAGVIILASAGRSATKTIQRTGRVMRPHAGKTEGVVYDFVDRGLIYAHAQWKARRRVYQELQYAVEDPAPFGQSEK